MNTITIQTDGWVSVKDATGKEYGLGDMGVDVQIVDRRIEIPYEELVGMWLSVSKK